MSKITANIINVYSIKSDDYVTFTEHVNLWNVNNEVNVPKARALQLKFANYFVKFQTDCEKTELTKTQVIELIEKSFIGFDNRRMRSAYKKYSEHYELIIAHATKVNSVSTCPINLVTIWNLAKSAKAKAKAEAEAKAWAKANPMEAKEAEGIKAEAEAKALDDKTKAEDKDKKVINRVQGAKHFERVVDPLRQGKTSPLTEDDVMSNLHNVHNQVIGFDNDDRWNKEQKAEVKRICLNTIKHLELPKDEDEDEQVKTLTEDVKANFPVIARQIASM